MSSLVPLGLSENHASVKSLRESGYLVKTSSSQSYKNCEFWVDITVKLKHSCFLRNGRKVPSYINFRKNELKRTYLNRGECCVRFMMAVVGMTS